MNFLTALSSNKDSGWLLLEEPENFLSPELQKIYIDIILSGKLQSKHIQMQKFITSHSPYIVQIAFNLCKNKKLSILRFNKTENGKVNILKVKLNNATFSEINYLAFNFPTTDFHNELYGFLQEKAIEESDENSFEDKFDKWLSKKLKTKNNYTWKKEQRNKSIKECDRTIQSYIRNFIHHPENTYNDKYTEQELRISIQAMIELKEKFTHP